MDLSRSRTLDPAIGKRGYYGFIIPELAQRCSLSNAGLLYHFLSKDELLLAVLCELEERETDILLPLVQPASETSQEDQSVSAVPGVLRTMMVRSKTQPTLGRLFAEPQVESPNGTAPLTSDGTSGAAERHGNPAMSVNSPSHNRNRNIGDR